MVALLPVASLLILVVAVYAGYKIYRTFIRRPTSYPTRAYIRRMQRSYPAPARMVCLGDSITQGDFGASYVSLLEKRLSPAAWLVLNAGDNGDLAVNALARLNAVIAAQPAVVTILIGTNDVLASMGPKEFRTYVWMGKIKLPPGSGDCLANVAEIVHRLQKETRARIALLSIPVISEDLDHEVNRRGDQYSDSLRDLAGRLNVDYLPLRETQKAYLKTTPKEARQPYENGDRLGMAAMAWPFLGLSWDTIAKRCGNRLSIDNIHSNSVSAAMIADLIEGFVRKGQAAQPGAAPL